MFLKIVQVVKVAGAAMAMSVLLLLLGAFIAYKLRLGLPQISLLAAVVYGIGSFVSGFGMGRLRREKRLMWGLGSGAVYFVFVLLISLIANHGVNADTGTFVRNIIICILSGGIGGALS